MGRREPAVGMQPRAAADPKAFPVKWTQQHKRAVLTETEDEEPISDLQPKARHRGAEIRRKQRASNRSKGKQKIPIIPGWTAAEVMAVQAPTLKSYLLLIWALVKFMMGLSTLALLPLKSVTQAKAIRFLRSLSPPRDEILDDGVAQSIDQTYWGGEEGGIGRRMLAALA